MVVNQTGTNFDNVCVGTSADQTEAVRELRGCDVHSTPWYGQRANTGEVDTLVSDAFEEFQKQKRGVSDSDDAKADDKRKNGRSHHKVARTTRLTRRTNTVAL